MDKPLVSVILPTLNRASMIKKSIESVLSQTFSDFELIVVNDGSTDATLDVVREFEKRDPRVKQIVNEKNLGLVRSLNKGIERASGTYIARIDDDDYWCDNEKLEKQITFLESNPDYVAAGGGVIDVDAKGREITRFFLLEQDKRLKDAILLHNPFAHSAVVFRKDAWEKTGGYDETLSRANCEDWDLWLKMGKLGKFYNFQHYFIRYLRDRQNKSNFNIRHTLRVNNSLRRKYRNDYPNFRKAYVLGWSLYALSFVPFGRLLKPLFAAPRRFILGRPVYIYPSSEEKNPK